MNAKIDELELHKKRLGLYITDFQTKYKNVKVQNEKVQNVISQSNSGDSKMSEMDKYSSQHESEDLQTGLNIFKGSVSDVVGGLNTQLEVVTHGVSQTTQLQQQLRQSHHSEAQSVQQVQVHKAENQSSAHTKKDVSTVVQGHKLPPKNPNVQSSARLEHQDYVGKHHQPEVTYMVDNKKMSEAEYRVYRQNLDNVAKGYSTQINKIPQT